MTDKSEVISEDNRIEEPIRGAHERPEEVERLVGELFELGRSWAGHGLAVGKLALQQSAHTLEVTAGVLGDISKRLRRD